MGPSQKTELNITYSIITARARGKGEVGGGGWVIM
jgi:hypothetical protein